MNSELYLTFPITADIRDRAAQFAEPVRHDRKKYDRIYRNTIAVGLMHYYVSQFLGIATDLAQSESWDLASRLVLDVADLWIPNIGSIECRTVEPGESVCLIPTEAWENRRGYAVLELNSDYTAGKVLGFTPALNPQQPGVLPLNTLQSIDALLDILEASETPSLQATIQTSITKLGNWLQGEFNGAWQSLSEGFQQLAAPQPEVAFNFRRSPSSEASPYRSAVQGQRTLILKQLPLALIVHYSPEAEGDRIQLSIKVCPTDDRISIPPDLQLIVSSGETVLKAAQRDIGNYVEKQLRGTSGEQFKVQVRWRDAEFTEEFEI
ncbi:DUF1822 family protein [Alkalinema sp. FACHB-956]|uniref:DUF1822 family protein n=1 Tax=Alkalinema sp. FACHB-956 TaxID=2692768 RepID=UPI001687E955|nr:DUF1822 family protein [Alkalinema sp. FACHB-956]MBD2329170.1 DUF1822 family protein [Alkalinema sp. FACHB-956]